MASLKLRRVAFSAAVVAAALSFARPHAQAAIVERVVAVIGERPVLWTELLKRAVAERIQIRLITKDLNVISAQEQEMYKELLDRMINERLEEQQADRAHISVSQEEVDRAIANIAAQAQEQQGRPVAVAEVLAEVRRRGLSEQDFHDEIRRQILEGKLIELRVRPRVRVTDQDARATYKRWVEEVRAKEMVEVRTLALRVLQGSTQSQVAARMALAQELAGRARSGEDFCGLVLNYTDDASTRNSCGSRGPQPFSSLLPSFQDAVRTTKPGEVSDPLPVDINGEEVIVLVMPMGRARVQTFEEVKDTMMQQAMIDGLERARKEWLQELRRNVYVDVRL
jgi:peptidyl-prolyl cis-trans isomerase SurA